MYFRLTIMIFIIIVLGDITQAILLYNNTRVSRQLFVESSTVADDLEDHTFDENDHSMVTNSNVFPYMATVMRASRYISSGALVTTNWVITAAEGIYLLRESMKLLRIRLGSINYKKGGFLSPVKLFEIHPYYQNKKPNFDLALVMLANPVRFTPNIRAIKLLDTPSDVTSTHFIVTSWPGPLEKNTNSNKLQSMDLIKRHRILMVAHLHPTDPVECAEDLADIGAAKDALMCLEPETTRNCRTYKGAPVVLNDVLWGVISAWKPLDCDTSSPAPILATLVSAGNVSTWIQAVIHGYKWNQPATGDDYLFTGTYDEDYDD